MNFIVLLCTLFNAVSLSSNIPLFTIRNSNLHPHSTFLKQPYSVSNEKGKLFMARQVPGDGACLFHSIGSWISFLHNRQHFDFDTKSNELSEYLRSLSVDILLRNGSLCLEDDYEFSGNVLTDIAASYNVSVEKYCSAMLHPKTWGGGPEIVALSNHLQCPIFVYQLAHERRGFFDWRKRFCLKLSAKFGFPAFRDKPPICLLCVDGRFPNIKPGEEKTKGDHFMALFPSTSKGELIDFDTSVFALEKCPLVTRITEQNDRQFVRNEVKRSLRRVLAFRKRHSVDSEPYTFKSVK